MMETLDAFHGQSNSYARTWTSRWKLKILRAISEWVCPAFIITSSRQQPWVRCVSETNAPSGSTSHDARRRSRCSQLPVRVSAMKTHPILAVSIRSCLAPRRNVTSQGCAAGLKL